MDPTTGQAPEQERVDRAEGELAALGPGVQVAGDAQDVATFGPAEVGVERQAGALADQRLAPRGAELLAERAP